MLETICVFVCVCVCVCLWICVQNACMYMLKLAVCTFGVLVLVNCALCYYVHMCTLDLYNTNKQQLKEASASSWDMYSSSTSYVLT